MKGLERTVVAAITATMLTSSTFASASHRNHESAPNSRVATGGGNLGCNAAQQSDLPAKLRVALGSVALLAGTLLVTC